VTLGARKRSKIGKVEDDGSGCHRGGKGREFRAVLNDAIGVGVEIDRGEALTVFGRHAAADVLGAQAGTARAGPCSNRKRALFSRIRASAGRRPAAIISSAIACSYPSSEIAKTLVKAELRDCACE
jgi:hypothetical protein